MEALKSARHDDPPALLSILTLTLCAFAVTTAEFVIAGLLPEVAADLSISIPSAGHLVTAYALGMVVGGPVLTLLTVRLPRKALIVSLLGVFVAGNVAAAAAPNYPALLAARAISGLVVATFFAQAVVIAASLAQPAKAGVCHRESRARIQSGDDSRGADRHRDRPAIRMARDLPRDRNLRGHRPRIPGEVGSGSRCDGEWIGHRRTSGVEKSWFSARAGHHGRRKRGCSDGLCLPCALADRCQRVCRGNGSGIDPRLRRRCCTWKSCRRLAFGS
ncbi:MAG: MFS transporter [Steroidobacteraceae bacterium]|nr:MFS transporter [Steroidobacteraceae bacterium]